MPILDKKDKEQVQKYQSFIQTYNGASAMQDLAWGTVKDNWIQEAVYLEEDGTITAAMTILLKKVPIVNSYMMYAPRGPVCDVEDIELVQRLLKEADILVKKYHVFMLKFDPEVKYSQSLEKRYQQAGFFVSGKKAVMEKSIQPMYNLILHLDRQTKEELMGQFSEKTRYNIRLATKKGVTVRYSNSEQDLKAFFKLHQVTTVRDGFLCRPYEYFKKVMDSYQGKVRIYLAEHEGEILSAAIAINYGGTVWYVYGSSSNEKRNLMPNYAMQSHMIDWAIETNCNYYNFGGIPIIEPDNGLYKFKIGFCKKEGVTIFIGEIDKVYRKGLYFLYTRLVPSIRKIKSYLIKKKESKK